MSTEKTCPKCKETLNSEKFFNIDNHRSDGFCSRCKTCENKRLNLYYIKQKEKIRLKQKERYHNGGSEYHKEYKKRNSVTISLQNKKNYARKKLINTLIN